VAAADDTVPEPQGRRQTTEKDRRSAAGTVAERRDRQSAVGIMDEHRDTSMNHTVEAEPPGERRSVRRAARRARLGRQRLLVLGGLALVALVVVVVIVLTAGGSGGDGLQRPGEPPIGYLREPMGGRKYRVTAWTLGGAASVRAALEEKAVDEVDFDWYHSQPDGSVLAQNEDLDLVAEAADAEVNVFATVVNSPRFGAAFSADTVSAILKTQKTRRRHVRALVRLVLEKGYDGIDLDWEELHAADRDRLSLFVEELAAALHKRGRFLSIAVFPKTSEPGSWSAQQVMDYARLGAVVDQFKIMLYAYSGPWSDPGPQAPFEWVDEVLRFARREVPPEKIYMGIPFFGYSWRAGTARAMTAKEVAALPQAFLNNAARDEGSGELILRFTDDYGVAHHAYVQDRAALQAKLEHLREEHPDIAGISIWAMGQEGPRFWEVVQSGL